MGLSVRIYRALLHCLSWNLFAHLHEKRSNKDDNGFFLWGHIWVFLWSFIFEGLWGSLSGDVGLFCRCLGLFWNLFAHLHEESRNENDNQNLQWCVCVGVMCVWGGDETESKFNTTQNNATQRNTLQHNATHCNTLQHTVTHCNTLQHTATHCNTLQHTKVCWDEPE